MENSYLTVTALTKYIKYRFDSDNYLSNVFLKGEISNFKHHSRGHFYFTIKDEASQINAVMFSSSAVKLKFIPFDGMKVLIQGRVSVYEATGNYQIYVDKLVEDGLGSLYIAYEQLKKELENEGYFKDEYKCSIPKFPKVIGVITSPTGAVIKDIINTVKRRYPLTKILLYPALVQGNEAKDSLVNCIKKANLDQKVDVIIIGRGGGSIEDLWPFNERIVAQAIFDSKIPIISAVGHETDFTIADYVSDLRAPTPTAAAELATPSNIELLKIIKNMENDLNKQLIKMFNEGKTKLVHLDQLLDLHSPHNKITNLQEKYVKLHYQLNLNIKNIYHFKELSFNNMLAKIKSFKLNSLVDKNKEKLENTMYKMNSYYKICFNHKLSQLEYITAKLSNLNPLAVLKRGYSVVIKNNRIIKSIHDVKADDELEIKLYDGLIKTIVKGE